MHNYFLGEFISRVTIARKKHFKCIRVPVSRVILDILRTFLNIGIIRGYKFIDNMQIEVRFKYYRGRAVCRSISLVSTPGKKIYVNLPNLYKMKEYSSGSILILSTSQGYLTDIECLEKNIGGEVKLKIKL